MMVVVNLNYHPFIITPHPSLHPAIFIDDDAFHVCDGHDIPFSASGFLSCLLLAPSTLLAPSLSH